MKGSKSLCKNGRFDRKSVRFATDERKPGIFYAHIFTVGERKAALFYASMYGFPAGITSQYILNHSYQAQHLAVTISNSLI